MNAFVPIDTIPDCLLNARGLTKEYERKTFLSKPAIARAVDSVDFHLEKASVTALVGASGSGKSTLSRCLAGLEAPTRGVVAYRGMEISRMTRAQMREYRRKVQIVFQEAAGTINPRFSVAQAISEPLRIAGVGDRGERRHRAIYWLEQVGLSAAVADKPALQLSGGERQRLAIARSLISNPEVIVFDESFSALDPLVESRLHNLLARLRASYNLTYLFIGHDLTMLARICSEVVVMYGGKIVERASTRTFFAAPAHAYSRELVRAIPCLPPEWLA
jgi:peptide/nickel transport system ATP-binding protein